MNKQELKEKINALTLTYYVSKAAVLDLIDQLDEPKIISQTQAVEFLAGEYNLTEDEVDKVLLNYRKPGVPSFVAEWINKTKTANILTTTYPIWTEDMDEESKRMSKWLDKEGNSDKFARAWLDDGYTVEGADE